MATVTVSMISGEALTFDVEADDIIDGLRLQVANAWPKPVTSRHVCIVTSDGSVPPGGSLILACGTEFAALVAHQGIQRAWEVHYKTIQELPQELNIVFVGDGRHTGKPGVGKTSLMFRLRDSLASTFCGWSEGAKGIGSGKVNATGSVEFYGCEHDWGNDLTSILNFSESAAGPGELRMGGYERTSVFVIVFSLDSKDSLKRVASKWIHEVVPGIPVVLVGTKADICAESNDSSLVSFHEVQELQRQIEISEYVECSALSGEGLEDVMDALLWAILMDAASEAGSARLASLKSSMFADNAACMCM